MLSPADMAAREPLLPPPLAHLLDRRQAAPQIVFGARLEDAVRHADPSALSSSDRVSLSSRSILETCCSRRWARVLPACSMHAVQLASGTCSLGSPANAFKS